VIPQHDSRSLTVTGIVEGATYLVLLAAVAWHAVLGGPDVVRALGLAHGIAFLGYAAIVLRLRPREGWDPTATLTLLLASALPGGGFVVARRRQG
jgi:integral membrane protein